MTSFTITARILPTGQNLTLSGWNAWALHQLHAAGEEGCTPIDNPAPRWSGYISFLRRMGFDIETRLVRHTRQLPDTCARYVLRSTVLLAVLSEEAAT